MPTIILPSAFIKFTNTRQCEIDGNSVGIIMHNLCLKFPVLKDYLFDKEENLSHFLSIFHNDVDIRQKSLLNTPVEVNDTVTILAPIAGG